MSRLRKSNCIIRCKKCGKTVTLDFAHGDYSVCDCEDTTVDYLNSEDEQDSKLYQVLRKDYKDSK